MTTSILENKQEHPNEQLYQQSQGLPLDSTFFNEQIHRIIDSVLPKVNNLLRKHLLFHAIFFILAISEIVFLFLFTTFLVQSSLLAFTLATIFLTCFSYYTLRIYFQSKKPQQIEEIVDLYIRGCKHLIAFREELPEHHLALADACTKFAVTLQGRESQFYRIPAW